MYRTGLIVGSGLFGRQSSMLSLPRSAQRFRRNQRDLAGIDRPMVEKHLREVGGWAKLVENGGIDFDFRFTPDHDLRLGQACAGDADSDRQRQRPIPLSCSAHRLPRQRFGVITDTQ